MNNVLRTLVYGGQASLTLIDTTELVNRGIQLHNATGASAYVYAKAMSTAAFMGACLKDDKGEISFDIQNDGAGGNLCASANKALRVRGYIDETGVPGGWDDEGEKACFGQNGSLTVIRDDGYARPFVGSCALPEEGGVDRAFEEYYRISEQLPTRIKTLVLQGETGCAFAGIAVLQLLPFADAETVEKMETFDLSALLFSLKEKGLEESVSAYFETDRTVWELARAEYKCNCSREYLAGVLVSLGEAQMREIIRADGDLRVHCHYCNTDYVFTDEDADKLFCKK